MKISTVEPKRPKTKVIIEMTDDEACALRDFMNPDEISDKTAYEFFKLIHELTAEW